MHAANDYKGLKLKLDGLVPPGSGFHRNLLFDAMYASLPRDPQVKVQIYNAEIVPGGFTNWHCHNGAAFFVALQGQFEAHFQEGVLVKAKAGECYSEPIAKFHRGHNPHPDLPYLCVGLMLHLARPRACDEFSRAAVVRCLHALSTVGQSTSSSGSTQGSLTPAACHSRQAGSAITASI